jgi:hypothetical protein
MYLRLIRNVGVDGTLPLHLAVMPRGVFLSTLQLDPPIPVVTPKGDGYAHILIDYGAEFNLLWVVFLDDSGECWTYDNSQIRAQKNVTMGRTFVSLHKGTSARASPAVG